MAAKGFNCLYGGRMNRCITSWSLYGNLQNSFDQHKAPRHTWHVLISPFTSRPCTEHTRHRCFVLPRPGQCLLWRVSGLPVLLEAEAGLHTGMDGRGSCTDRASISLIRVSWKSLREIFFPPHEDKRMYLLTTARSNRWKKNFFVHFHVRRLTV